MMTYVALLRGINVGSHSKVAMGDLRRLFLALGHADAKTHVQSGNVIFRCHVDEPSRLAGDIERRVASDLGVKISVLLRTKDELAHVLTDNPFRTRELDLSKLHVTFLADRPDPQRVTLLETPAGESDEFNLVGREVYLHCPNGYGRTKLNNAYLERRLGVVATTRSWNTLTKLCDLASG